MLSHSNIRIEPKLFEFECRSDPMFEIDPPIVNLLPLHCIALPRLPLRPRRRAALQSLVDSTVPLSGDVDLAWFCRGSNDAASTLQHCNDDQPSHQATPAPRSRAAASQRIDRILDAQTRVGCPKVPTRCIQSTVSLLRTTGRIGGGGLFLH